MTPRIVGGEAVVDPQERGFMAYLALFDGESFGSCGGALIREDWVVTAAHYVDDRTPCTLRVIPGGQEVPDPREIVNNWREWNAVKRIVVHQDWEECSMADGGCSWQCFADVCEWVILAIMDEYLRLNRKLPFSLGGFI